MEYVKRDMVHFCTCALPRSQGGNVKAIMLPCSPLTIRAGILHAPVSHLWGRSISSTLAVNICHKYVACTGGESELSQKQI